MNDVATAPSKSATRCGFHELAEQINEAHKLAKEHAESAIDHAFRAGNLLREAKGLVSHGQWLPWLRENVGFSERTAQAYMRLAAKQESIRSNLASDDGISVRRALDHLRRPLRSEYRAEEQDSAEREASELSDDDDTLLRDVFGGDVWEFATHLLDRPFCAYDVDGDEDWLRHFGIKLLHHAGVGGEVGALLSMLREYEPIPLLRLAPADEMLEAMRQLFPIAESEAPLPMETRAISHARAILGTAEIMASWFCGAILVEFDHRETLDDETYLAEFEDVRERFVATSKARLDAVQEVKAQHERGEFGTLDEHFAALKQAERVAV